jgi:hypothetical protein
MHLVQSLLQNKDSQDHRYAVTGTRREGNPTRRRMIPLAILETIMSAVEIYEMQALWI